MVERKHGIPGRQEPADQEKQGQTRPGGAVYPFLEHTGRAWRIFTRPLGRPADYPLQQTFGLDQPTLRWLNADKVNDVHVEGMTTEQFLEAVGLEFQLDNGAFV